MEEQQSQESKKNEYSKSYLFLQKVWDYVDWITWIIIGFFLREVLVRWGVWKSCPLISECMKCYTYGGLG